MKILLIIFSLGPLFNCSSSGPLKEVLNKSQALNFAVKISNETCKSQFGVTPFNENSYDIEYKDGYWFWGVFDASGINGYSVTTKFDKFGKNDTVQVFFSEDAINIERPPEEK